MLNLNINDKISAPIISKEQGTITDVIMENDSMKLLEEFYNITEKEDFQFFVNCNSGKLVRLALNDKNKLDIGLMSTGWNEYNYEIVEAAIVKVQFGGFLEDMVLSYIKGKNNNLDGLFLPVNIRYGMAMFNNYKGI